MLPAADVVVVGGGVVGTAVTYYLAKHGVQVCLVERADIASGTSSACGHVVALQTKPIGPKLDLACASIALYKDLEEELEADIEFSTAGSILVAETEAEADFVQAKVQQLQRLGIDVEFVDGDLARTRQPALAGHICGASFCSADSTVNPMRLALGFARAAGRLGAVIRTFTEVEGIERQGDRIFAVLTKRGKIPTSTVVNAAGVWSPMLAEMAGLNLPIVPRKGELFVTERVPPIVRGIIVSGRYLMSKALPEPGKGAGEMRAGVIAAPTRSGNLLLGSTREFAGFDRRSTHRAIRELTRRVTTIVPALGNVHVLRFYAGLRPSTPDGLPILGRSPELPGFVIASGHEGDGIALSPITGKAIAELVVGEIEDEELAPFSLSRFATEQRITSSPMTKARPGMRVERRPPRQSCLDAGVVPATPRRISEGSDGVKRVEVAIVGGGPAGIAAAIEATAGGASVLVIDVYEQPGGHYFKPLPTAFQPAAGDADERRAELRSLMASASKLGVEVLSGTTVWGVFRGEGATGARSETFTQQARLETFTQQARSELLAPRERPEERFLLCLHGPHTTRCVEAQYLILATGAYDRPMPFPGWTLPGVITPGAAQMLLRGQGILPGRRVLVAGSGPLPLAVAAGLAEAGAYVAGVLDTASWRDGWRAMLQAWWAQWARLREAWRYWRTLQTHNVPILLRHAIFQALGEGEVQAAVIGQVDAQGRPLWHTERTVAVDTLCVGFGFLPNIALSRQAGCHHTYDAGLDIWVPQHDDTFRTNVPGVYVAGDVTGIGGKDLAMLQGQVASLNILQELGRLAPETVERRVRELSRKIEREKRLVRMLRERLRPLPGRLELINDDTIVCRCEEVTAGQIKEAVANGARDVRGVKIRTRAGMGPCQGRYCEMTVGALVARESGRAREDVGFMTARPPVIPVPAQALGNQIGLEHLQVNLRADHDHGRM